MLQRAVNIAAFRAEEMNQKVTVHIDRSIPRNLINDEQRLAQVITNLLSNAVKFTPEGGEVSLDTRLVSKEKDEFTVQVTITDTGIGISPEQQELLFQSFQQAELHTSRKYGGTGLGLAISKNIVEKMGGSIWIESDLGEGAKFSFTFKAKRGERYAPNLSEIGVDWSNITILAVDDDKYVLDYFTDVINSFGKLCDVASSGEEALELVEANGMYDICFIDWKMPGMDGIELANKLRNKSDSPDHSVIIMISAAEWSGVASEAKEAGVDKFLSKPLFPSSIVDMINEAIGIGYIQEDDTVDFQHIFKGFKILLAEDVDINREIVEVLIEPTSLEMDWADNGSKAVSMFEKSPKEYDLILMDVQMPEMDGYEATRRIRSLNIENAKTIPIVAMTANVFREDVDKCLEAGMTDHLGKPIEIEEFIGTLQKYLVQEKD